MRMATPCSVFLIVLTVFLLQYNAPAHWCRVVCGINVQPVVNLSGVEYLGHGDDPQ